MAFKNATEALQPWLDLPIGEKTYRIPAASIATGLYCQRAAELALSARLGTASAEDLAALKLDDDQERDFNRRMLTTAYDEMVADGVDWQYVGLAARTAFQWTVNGRDVAEEYWNRGGQRAEAGPGNDRRPAPQDRRPASRTAKTTARKTTARKTAAKKTTPRKRTQAKPKAPQA